MITMRTPDDYWFEVMVPQDGEGYAKVTLVLNPKTLARMTRDEIEEFLTLLTGWLTDALMRTPTTDTGS